MDKIENPYEKMEKDVLQTHIEQLSSVVKVQEIDVKQFFGIAEVLISKEDQSKIDQHPSLVAEVDKLTLATSSKDMSEADIATTKVGLDGLLLQIKDIDANIDVSTIGSKFNNLERMSILNDLKPLIADYVGQIATVKKEIGTKPVETDQQFSAPKGDKSASDLIKAATKTK